MDSGNGYFFAKILLIFTINIDSKEYGIAFVKSFSISQRSLTNYDKDLGLHRVYSSSSKPYEFIPIHSIVREALIVSDYDKSDQAFILDVIDTDTYLRLQTVFPDFT